MSRKTLSSVRHGLRRIGARLAPLGTARGRWARTIARSARQVRLRVANGPGLALEQVLHEAADRKGIVIHPPFIDWTWMRQRPHQLMAQFAKAGYLSLFCSPRLQTDSFRGFVRVAERLYLCDTLRPLYNIPHSILLATWTSHCEMVDRFRQPVVIYDYLDDLGVSSSDGVPDRRKLEQHRKLATRSEIVLATARRLYDEIKTIRSDALFCPNGVDYEHFHPAAAPPVPADIAELAASGRPIIGYYGALARWFDYDLVAHAATVRKDCEFLLIGPDYDGTLSSSRLASLPNVRWVGEKKYEELPAYLHYFTVATIPFVVNRITEATCPIKLFEYMAGGRPIVTTDMPECRKYACVSVARDSAEYAAMLDGAIGQSKSDAYRQLLDAEARNNTWEARVRQIVARLDAINVAKRTQAA